mmetsp:Transcript_24548/g.54782  ORF Transcript_24548/g.54782 Transcript_24548/m.54782 type:complete len:597 (+) Transcript_24548:402-2192(+)
MVRPGKLKTRKSTLGASREERISSAMQSLASRSVHGTSSKSKGNNTYYELKPIVRRVGGLVVEQREEAVPASITTTANGTGHRAAAADSRGIAATAGASNHGGNGGGGVLRGRDSPPRSSSSSSSSGPKRIVAFGYGISRRAESSKSFVAAKKNKSGTGIAGSLPVPRLLSKQLSKGKSKTRFGRKARQQNQQPAAASSSSSTTRSLATTTGASTSHKGHDCSERVELVSMKTDDDQPFVRILVGRTPGNHHHPASGAAAADAARVVLPPAPVGRGTAADRAGSDTTLPGTAAAAAANHGTTESKGTAASSPRVDTAALPDTGRPAGEREREPTTPSSNKSLRRKIFSFKKQDSDSAAAAAAANNENENAKERKARKEEEKKARKERKMQNKMDKKAKKQIKKELQQQQQKQKQLEEERRQKKKDANQSSEPGTVNNNAPQSPSDERMFIDPSFPEKEEDSSKYSSARSSSSSSQGLLGQMMASWSPEPGVPTVVSFVSDTDENIRNDAKPEKNVAASEEAKDEVFSMDTSAILDTMETEEQTKSILGVMTDIGNVLGFGPPKPDARDLRMVDSDISSSSSEISEESDSDYYFTAR